QKRTHAMWGGFHRGLPADNGRRRDVRTLGFAEERHRRDDGKGGSHHGQTGFAVHGGQTRACRGRSGNSLKIFRGGIKFAATGPLRRGGRGGRCWEDAIHRVGNRVSI